MALLPPGIPNQAENQADAQGVRSAAELAREVAEQHQRALRSRRDRDLVAEKILLHIDGRGDNQWADVWNGQRVAIPPDVVEFKETEPLLGPIVANQIAYHCTMPLRFLAEAKNDSEAKQRAKIDTAFANFIAQTQKWNNLAAVGMLFADAIGFCPLHNYWRDDVGFDPYEPLYLSSDEQQGLYLPRKGIVDSWVGNPFDHTFNAGAKRGSVAVQCYGRVLPAQMIRDRMGVEVEGSRRMPSASVMQRIARLWNNLGDLSVHGSPALQAGGGDHEELVAVICREIAPGVDPEWPEGRLTVVALPGTDDTRKEGRTGAGRAVLLSDQPLPAGRFSSVLLYSSSSFDDVHGSPWAEPIDNLQVQLNIARSKERALLEKLGNAPIMVGGTLAEEEQEFDGWTILQVDAAMNSFPPRVMEMGNAAIKAWAERAEIIRQAMYTIGGYQAASRGESNAGDPFAKTALLAQADDTIHGSANIAFREAMSEYAQLAWALMKRYGDVPWVVDAVGDEWEELPEEYIDNTMLSEQPPTYRVVSGYGATPEIKGRQLMTLFQLGLLRPDEFRKQWPDGSLFSDEIDPLAAQRKRAKRVANHIRRISRQFRQEQGVQGTEMMDPEVQMAGRAVFMLAEQRFPRLRDDDLQANLAALSEITQDETADGIARVAATLRQEPFWEWQAQMAAQAAPMMLGPGGGGGEAAPRGTPDIDAAVEIDPATAASQGFPGGGAQSPLSAAV